MIVIPYIDLFIKIIASKKCDCGLKVSSFNITKDHYLPHIHSFTVFIILNLNTCDYWITGYWGQVWLYSSMISGSNGKLLIMSITYHPNLHAKLNKNVNCLYPRNIELHVIGQVTSPFFFLVSGVSSRKEVWK